MNNIILVGIWHGCILAHDIGCILAVYLCHDDIGIYLEAPIISD